MPAGQLSMRTMASCYNCCAHSLPGPWYLSYLFRLTSIICGPLKNWIGIFCKPEFVLNCQLKQTRKPSCRWQTRATLAKSLHGLRKSSGVVSCIARLPIDSVPMVSYYVLYSNCVCKMRRFGDTRLLKLPWPWNPGQGSLRVIESDIIR